MSISKLLIFFISLGFLLRTVSLEAYPIGFTPDEASFGYDAYSILKTGKDQWGQPWPFVLRSFGDYKLPVYSYLTIPSVAVFGLNEFSVRLPNAIFGVFSILFTFLLARVMFKSSLIGLVSAILLTISPWHISLSRGAFEANLFTFFFTAGLWAFLKGLEKTKFMIIACILFGINIFTYHSARYLTIFFLIGLFFIFRLELYKNIRKYKLAIVLSLIFALLILYSQFLGAGSRTRDIFIFNPTGGLSEVANKRYEATLINLPDFISRIFSNKFTFFGDNFITSYLSYFSPQFLFTQGAGETTYGMISGRGVLYLFELVFLGFSIVNIKKVKDSKILYTMLVWLFLSPLPAALTKGPGFAANRVAVMMPLIQMISAFGAVQMYIFIRNYYRFSNKFIIVIFSFVILSSLTIFLEDYIFHTPARSSKSMLYGRQEAVEYAITRETSFNRIVISRTLSEPQIYLAFYKKIDPKDYQSNSKNWLSFEKQGLKFVDQMGEYSFGKYTFGDFKEEYWQKGNMLIGTPSEFPKEIHPQKIISSPSGEKLIYIFEI